MGNPEKLATQSAQDEEKPKQKHNTICVGYKYAQANTNNGNKACAFLQTAGSKDKPNIVSTGKSQRTSERKDT